MFDRALAAVQALLLAEDRRKDICYALASRIPTRQTVGYAPRCRAKLQTL